MSHPSVADHLCLVQMEDRDYHAVLVAEARVNTINERAWLVWHYYERCFSRRVALYGSRQHFKGVRGPQPVPSD